MRYSNLPTEQANDRSRDLDLLETTELIALIHEEDRGVPDAVREVLPAVAQVVDLAAAALEAGGRLVYAGAGTSGRLGVLDAAECPPTFSVDPSRVVGLIAGGRDAVFKAVEGAEDRADEGAAAALEIGVGPNDLLVGIAASGVTPWVAGAIDQARSAGARTAFVTCGEAAPDRADVVISLRTGPEILAGSTRMKAGTATKLVLNMISTGAMVKIGKVYDNLMVDLTAGSRKLRRRALRIVRRLTGLSGPEAETALADAGGEVKTAVAAARLGIAPDRARRRLDLAGGRLRAVLEEGVP